MSTQLKDRIAANKQVAKHLAKIPKLSTAGAPVEDLVATISREIHAQIMVLARAENPHLIKPQTESEVIDLDGNEEEKDEGASDKDKDERPPKKG